ncbi:netrin-4 isoform X2 [Clupea harengus]|uniref:Netrin-4 isoform X2 n=1 Tax=Clupea harengus TaxID=7950 RepID=A0A8M1KIN8_CLUHA|nr:netrin-4 isoform X2 [Clupea harengus]
MKALALRLLSRMQPFLWIGLLFLDVHGRTVSSPHFMASRCMGHACSPPVGNLATGRVLHTLTGCCRNGSRESCSSFQHPCSDGTHSPAQMADDPFLHPDTWWESAAGQGQDEEIHLDLDSQFCLTHVVMLFRSPRPATMVLERSIDFGQSWQTLKFFALNCSSAFGLADDTSQPGSLCTSRYSSAKPCSGGEVIFRSIGKGREVDDPYSPEGLALLTLTNLRIRLLKPQVCAGPPPHFSRDHSNPETLPGVFSVATKRRSAPSEPATYAIYSLLARGTCLCHGHAEQCLPTHQDTDQLPLEGMVAGRCVCSHQTAGEHCERCAPLYNDRPWRPANGSSGQPNPCQKCECHGHAESCHFSQRVWLSTGGTGGGVCDNCQHNTVGRRCQRCRPGYHRHPAMSMTSPHACTRCWCDPVGSIPPQSKDQAPGCHPRSGQCHCKTGVGGASCNQCLSGYWAFGPEGCKPCACPLKCDALTGHCIDSDKLYHIPIGGKIPDLLHVLSNEDERTWPKELAVSALYYTGKCNCKDRKLRGVADLCKTKHAYAIKASVLSAHDKGSHAVVLVKVRKVLRSGKVSVSQGTHSIYPLSWTSRGCTCPILNPGIEYLLAGPEEVESGRLLVTMQSLVVPWTPMLGHHVAEGLRQGCL